MNYICLNKDFEKLRSWKMSFQEIIEKTFFTTNENIDFSDKLNINGQNYHSCCSAFSDDRKDKYYLVEPFDFKEDPDEEMEDEITCPYCGYSSGDSFEAPDEDDKTCESCGSNYAFSRNVSVCYTSIPVNKNKTIKELLND